MWRRIGGLAALVVFAAFALAAWRFGPAASLALALAVPSTEPAIALFASDGRREEIAIPVGSRQPLHADLYRPARPRGAFLLVHGLSRAGRRQPDLERLARLLASQGLVIVVPQFEGLAAFRLEGGEVADVREALRHTAALAALPSGAPVGIAGFSFGAGPAIIAAADVPNVRVVASFGGYADLRNVLTYITTGAHTFAGRHYQQPQEEYNRWKLLALLVPLVPSSSDGARLDGVAQRKLMDPAADTSDLERGLGADGRAVLALVVNRREEAVERLLAALPPASSAALESLSAVSAIARVRGRIVLAHGVADASIPYTESLRLAAAAGDRAHLALFRTFHHTGPERLSSSLLQHAADGWRLLQVVDEILRF